MPSAQFLYSKKFWIISTLLFWCSLFFFRQTNLAASDLGRHVMNGKIIIESGRVFQTNLYSYTNPDFPALQHHWLFGVISYLIHQVAGFAGLTWMGVILYTAAIGVIVAYSSKKTALYPTVIATLFVLPLFAHRSETRPEAFSLFFFALLYVLIVKLLERPVQKWWYLGIAVILMLWVNIHIFFVLGTILFGSALLHLLANKQPQRFKPLVLLGLAGLAGALINPRWIWQVLYPLQIFGNYGYRVSENQHLWFFLTVFPGAIYWYLLAVMVAVIAASFYLFKTTNKKYLYQIITALVFVGFAFRLTRLENILALVAIPVLATAGSQLWHTHKKKISKVLNNELFLMAISIPGLSLIIVLLKYNLLLPFQPNFGVGLLPGYQQSIAAIQQLPLKEPIFNNFDSGSFLIYALYPEKKVFMDNRAEAYPADFIINTYTKMQEDESRWQEVDEQYNFQTIIYYRHENTNWGQEFMVKRVQDQSWVPIYVDNYLLIFVKDNPENAELINQFRLPDEMFGIRAN